MGLTSSNTELWNSISHTFKKFVGEKECELLMLGFEGAGKSTILYKLKLGEVKQTIPTIGVTIEEVTFKNIQLIAWDVGNYERRFRALWRQHYFRLAKGLIYVVDSCDRYQIDGAAEEFHSVINDPSMVQCTSILILANKQDLPNALLVSQVADKMGLYNLRGKEWYIKGSSAITGEGILEGLIWLKQSLLKNSDAS